MARITIRKTRKGTTITMRADKGEDLRNVIKEMAAPITTVRQSAGHSGTPTRKNPAQDK